MAKLALFNEGVRDHFPICENFCGNFFEGFFADGVLDHFPICGMRIHLYACDNGMDHANGDEIPALGDAIDVCASKHQSALIGGMGILSPSAGPKARG